MNIKAMAGIQLGGAALAWRVLGCSFTPKHRAVCVCVCVSVVEYYDTPVRVGNIKNASDSAKRCGMRGLPCW